MRRPPNMSKFDEKNLVIMEKYRRTLELQQLGPLTINGYFWKLYTALNHLKLKPADEVTKEDIQDFIIFRRNNNKQRTVNGDIIALKKFFNWLKPGNDLFEDIKVKRQKPYLPVSQLLSTDDVKSMLSVCKRQRDRAWLMVLWDTGCRLNEILSRNINDIQFDDYGATLTVDGKTGMRKLRLIDSLPDLRQWLNQHPLKNTPGAPLFVTERRYDKNESKILTEKRLDHNTIQNSLKTLGKLAGVTKNVHAHAFRHARLTQYVKQGFMESELRHIAGWTRSSAMVDTYIHLSGGDVDKKILRTNGLIKDQEEFILKSLKPGKCPRCATDNSVDAKYCSICGLILDQNVAKDIDEKTKSIPGLLAALQHDPEFLKLLTKHL